MRGALAALALIALAGCNSEARNAERAFDIANADGGSPDDACRAAGEAAAAWLKAGDQAKYSEWKSRRDVTCYNASQRRGIF